MTILSSDLKKAGPALAPEESEIVSRHDRRNGRSKADAESICWGEDTSQPAYIEDLGGNLFFVAASPAMRSIRAQVDQVARVDVPILCLGPSGTGKEVVAQLIHKLSLRSQRTFLKVNCAALPAELLESELFGYEAGAFTGAARAKPGKFELCNKGTIFLDEIAEMPPSLQAKLLHVLQDQEFSRLGGCSRIKVDVRILAATNVDVQQAITTRRLREDLFYRLSSFVFQLPPLRERRQDIPVLLRHYMRHFASRYELPAQCLSERILEFALRYDWPGNVRELENFVKRYLILGDEALLLRELETKGDTNGHSAVPHPLEGEPSDLRVMLHKLKDQVEMEAIRRTLEQTDWNRKEAARRLRISYKAILYKIRQHGLDETRQSLVQAAY
jgi:two-component system, NtrC family, response regulator AtoC